MANVFKIPGGGVVTVFDDELMLALIDVTRLKMEKITFLYEQKLKVLTTQSPKGGRFYRVSARPRRGLRGGARGGAAFHKASAAGEPPAVDTGFLRSSIRSSVKETSDGVLGIVSSPLIYARFLEQGTRRMAPRPLWGPALSEIEPEIRKILEE